MRKNRTALDQLKVEYDELSISVILSKCHVDRKEAIKGRRALILKLYYLERTKRFREKKAYKQVAFNVFLNYEFNLRYGTYEKERIAFIAHEKYAMIYGPALVSKVRKVCGVMNVDTVFSKMKLDDPVERKEKIIRAYAIKRKKKKVDKRLKDTPTEIERQLRRQVAEDQKTIKKQFNQIQKLKATVEKYKSENVVLRKENKKLRAKRR